MRQRAWLLLVFVGVLLLGCAPFPPAPAPVRLSATELRVLGCFDVRFTPWREPDGAPAAKGDRLRRLRFRLDSTEALRYVAVVSHDTVVTRRLRLAHDPTRRLFNESLAHWEVPRADSVTVRLYSGRARTLQAVMVIVGDSLRGTADAGWAAVGAGEAHALVAGSRVACDSVGLGRR